MKIRRGVERENFVVMLGRGEERELLGVIKERTSVWAHKLCFIYIHTHTQKCHCIHFSENETSKNMYSFFVSKLTFFDTEKEN